MKSKKLEKESTASFHFRDTDAFVAYSLPGDSDHNLVFQNDKGHGTTFDSEVSGFVISPFDRIKGQVDVIQPDNIIKNGRFLFESESDCNVEATSKSDYLQAAEETISDIRLGIFEKVVLSRVKLVDGKIYDLFRFFCHLNDQHTKAFVYLYHLPGKGTWCGASPETLLKREEKGYSTMALAATQRDNGLPLEMVDWTEKEVHEQRVIEEFVEQRLNERGLSYAKKGPTTVRAADLLHLCTQYNIGQAVGWNELTEVLHPGPAICGTPQREAFQKIMEIESHDRRDYCGFIGPIRILQESALFVNLRCMQIFKNTCALYVGGGLTARSQPGIEWEETELKANTMSSVLEKTYI